MEWAGFISANGDSDMFLTNLQTAIDQIKGLYPLVAEETSLDALRGEEGTGAKVYFDVFVLFSSTSPGFGVV